MQNRKPYTASVSFLRKTILVLTCWLMSTLVGMAADVTGLRIGQNGDVTRLVIDMKGKVTPQYFLLANPNRIVVDLPGANWRASRTLPATGVIDKYRHGKFSTDVYRLVIDLKSAATVKSAFSLPARDGYGPRFVIDIQPSTQAAFDAAVKSTRSVRPRDQQPVRIPLPDSDTGQSSGKGRKRVIVVDPGHGGVDPGAIGVLGVNEKVITLNLSRQIKRVLEATGRYRVFLTRDKDIYIAHRKRFDFARRVNADFFISIHADSIKNRNIRGGSVYTLNDRASDHEAALLAAKENKSDVIAGVDLGGTDDEVSSILIELAQRETLNYSAQFAEILVPEMRKQVRMLKTGHRYASLMVLRSPDIPSVLVETGYLSNREDARLLNSRTYQQKIARSMLNALDKYFEEMTALGR